MLRRISLAIIFMMPALGLYASEAGINISTTMLRGKVFQRGLNSQPYLLNLGGISLASGAAILTSSDGQCFMQPGKDLELRLKEDTNMAFVSSSSLELRKGILGVRVATFSAAISTPHLEIILHPGLFVVKVNPVMTRICVIKGTAEVWRRRSLERKVLIANQELAAATGTVSKVYPRTDELRFTWYWVEPEKEPGLMD